MLLNLHIKNMALIDEMDIDFSDGLNILTGETGAGKSIVIDSVMLALGGKTPKDFVRKDAESGSVELLFSVENEETVRQLKEMEVPELENGEIILSRKIMGNRSVSKVNGETVTISKLREIAGLILDLHAQHEHQSLLVPANHMKLLDRFGHETIAGLLENVKNDFNEYSKIKEELLANTIDEDEIARKLDLIRFEQQEIEAAVLKPGEDEQLEDEYKLASNSKNIMESLSAANGLAYRETLEAVDRAIREMRDISGYDEALASMTEQLETASELLSDFSRSARQYMEENMYSEEDFRALEERLNLINHLKAKYGKTIDDIIAYGKDNDVELDKLSNHEEYINDLRASLELSEKKLKASSNLLHEERVRVAGILSDNIKNALTDLNFLDVHFDIVFEKTDGYKENGYDFAYFIISTNVGEDMKPLWQVASGGELSRIMLAIKSCLADSDNIETLIFDEIDVGISGRTAQMVAEKIHDIAGSHQVICITHLPQIAAMANHHYLIEKKVEGEKTNTYISHLDREAEIMEIARLIGGVEITDTVIESAREMKDLAGKAKVN